MPEGNEEKLPPNLSEEGCFTDWWDKGGNCSEVLGAARLGVGVTCAGVGHPSPKSGLSTDPAQLCLLLALSDARLRSETCHLVPWQRLCYRAPTTFIRALPGSGTRESQAVSLWRCVETASPMVTEGPPLGASSQRAPASSCHLYGWRGGKTDTQTTYQAFSQADAL